MTRHSKEIEVIRKAVESLGGSCSVTSQGHRLRGSAGVPDLYLQFPRLGLSLWFEVKVGDDGLRPEQREFIAREHALDVLVGDSNVLFNVLWVKGLEFKIT